MLNIFLSYARADGADAATKLRLELERAGFDVWRDKEKMRGGEEWKEQLREALRSIDVVLLLLTPASVASPVVTWEWENALTLKKHVIPLLVLACDVPTDLRRLHYHDMTTPESYVMSMMAVLGDLNRIEQAKSQIPQEDKGPAEGDWVQSNWNVKGNVYQSRGDMSINHKEED